MPRVNVYVGSAKTPKMGVSESGDTLEVVERRKGGLTVVLADGQGSGPAAKRISSMVVGRAMTLIAEGVRDGAAARAAHDFLFALRDGKVSCELIIISADAHTKSVVVSRNTEVPVIVRTPEGGVRVVDEDAVALGVYEYIKPSILQIPMEPGTIVLAMTDGITQAGERTGKPLQLADVSDLVAGADCSDPQALADSVLALALNADSGFPKDDMCAVVMSVSGQAESFRIRKLSVEFPM